MKYGKSARALLLGGVLGMAGIMTSCQSSGGSMAESSAVMCDKCQTVWVKKPHYVGSNSGKGGMIVYRNKAVMQCPECESAAATFFKSGKLQHTCTHCGGTMAHCTQH